MVPKIILFLPIFRQFAFASQPCTLESFNTLLPPLTNPLRALALPDNSTFSDPNDREYTANTTALPSLCVLEVNGTSSETSHYRFGAFLPDEWNGRFAVVGNGGQAGGVNWPAMGTMVKYGFAVISTNTGHESASDDASWMTMGEEAIIDNAYRAMHLSIVNGKEIVQKYYGRNITYSYYNGCSTGGRQALVEVQRFPEDFDGVLAGAPAWESTKIAPWMVQMGAMNLPNTSDHHIQPALYPVIQAEVMRQCDPVDGVEDGVISDPQACHFRPETLLCNPQQSQNSTTCLNSAQVDTLHKLYGHYFTISQPMFYHPLSYGTEPSWRGFLPPDEPIKLGADSFRYALGDPNWTWQDLNISIIEEARGKSNPISMPGDFDIRPFAERGAKLMHWHGLGDALIPYQSSRTFYEAVYRNISSRSVDYEVGDFYRLFEVPGMLHCAGSNGDAPWYFGPGSGPEELGPDVYGVPGFRDAEHDAVLALMRWVEEGVAPDWITSTKFVNDTIELGVRRQRKLCPYPGRARFVSGDVDLAENWEC
ncbi:putative ferulic acid Esterase/Feruloyl esterase [Corynespora cassiicola Philippines]|uniref:Carboxylic ester hydrolase n=1 Tax=Corynespora cassiicola Philippines TaxID=1448308 RepID=A0A2T2NX36_CORCC|nr:putative ferulic acid Esterase/Feruloyl esterase [Corynespora cassiicola Philippines]